MKTKTGSFCEGFLFFAFLVCLDRPNGLSADRFIMDPGWKRLASVHQEDEPWPNELGCFLGQKFRSTFLPQFSKPYQ